MSLVTFLSACLALLIAPGPTNTLMALAGAEGGMARVLRLIPYETLAYLAAILTIGGLFGPVILALPGMGLWVKGIAAAWVMVLAVRLWRRPQVLARQASIRAWDIAVTTALNPKALVFALVLLPLPGTAGHGLRLTLLAFLIMCVALLWGGFGRMLAAGPGSAPRLPHLQRLAALWLGLLPLTMAIGVLRA